MKKTKAQQTFDKMADAYAALDGPWTKSTIADKRRLLKIAQTKTQGNCWWAEYGAAQHIIARLK